MKRYRFETALQRSTGWGAFVLFPHDTQSEFGIKGRVPIQALISGHPYTGSLMPTSATYHRLSIPKPIREALNKSAGDLIEVELWHDTKPRTVDLPDDFAKHLKEHRLLSAFENLTITRRKEYRNYITTPKREDTRQRRMIKALSLLKIESKTRA
jgi:bifunctional DNA-binding transcriptional regulator/antitoxin component of YhaV-PrlF toxin-antitoxin module